MIRLRTKSIASNRAPTFQAGFAVGGVKNLQCSSNPEIPAAIRFIARMGAASRNTSAGKWSHIDKEVARFLNKN